MAFEQLFWTYDDLENKVTMFAILNVGKTVADFRKALIDRFKFFPLRIATVQEFAKESKQSIKNLIILGVENGIVKTAGSCGADGDLTFFPISSYDTVKKSNLDMQLKMEMRMEPLSQKNI